MKFETLLRIVSLYLQQYEKPWIQETITFLNDSGFLKDEYDGDADVADGDDGEDDDDDDFDGDTSARDVNEIGEAAYVVAYNDKFIGGCYDNDDRDIRTRLKMRMFLWWLLWHPWLRLCFFVGFYTEWE